MGIKIPISVVDAFTAEPFAGNPAAVCRLAEPADTAWMQNVAAEMNLSETAFVVPSDDGFGLRWFTPTIEVELCGHATLASAHVLWSEGVLDPATAARFHTQSGQLGAVLRDGWIEIDLPAEPVTRIDPLPGLAEALGAVPHEVYSSSDYLFVLLADEQTVRALQPDQPALAALECRAVAVTAAASRADFDFVSRFFAPAIGIAEDPVTGAAHCRLGPFWAARLGKDDMRAFQCSARGGELRVGNRGDRVLLGGQAVTTLRGEFLAACPI